jgi:hypothetical protein
MQKKTRRIRVATSVIGAVLFGGFCAITSQLPEVGGLPLGNGPDPARRFLAAKQSSKSVQRRRVSVDLQRPVVRGMPHRGGLGGGPSTWSRASAD